MWGCDYLVSSSWHGFGSYWVPGTLLVVIALLLLGFLLHASKGESKRRYGDRDDSLEILKLRLAKGEITQETYLEMRKVLEQA